MKEICRLQRGLCWQINLIWLHSLSVLVGLWTFQPNLINYYIYMVLWYYRYFSFCDIRWQAVEHWDTIITSFHVCHIPFNILHSFIIIWQKAISFFAKSWHITQVLNKKKTESNNEKKKKKFSLFIPYIFLSIWLLVQITIHNLFISMRQTDNDTKKLHVTQRRHITNLTYRSYCKCSCLKLINYVSALNFSLSSIFSNYSDTRIYCTRLTINPK